MMIFLSLPLFPHMPIDLHTFSVHGDKPWQRRWVTFNGTELKYFKNQSDKDKSSRNIIPLAEMIDIKKVPDVSGNPNTLMCIF